MNDMIESGEGVTEQDIDPAYFSDDELSSAITEGDEDDDAGLEPIEGESQEPGVEPNQAAPAAQVTTPQSYTPEQVQQLVADREKHQRMIAQQERFIQQQKTEWGTMRSQLLAAKEALRRKLSEDDGLTPLDTAESVRGLQQIDSQLEDINQQESYVVARQGAMTTVQQYIPQPDWDVEAMTESLRADGVPQEFIQAFKQDPFATASGENLVHLAKRARAEKAVVALWQENQALKQQAEQLRGKPQRLLKNVARELNRPPTITTGSNGSKADATIDLSTREIANLTDDELNYLLSQSVPG